MDLEQVKKWRQKAKRAYSKIEKVLQDRDSSGLGSRSLSSRSLSSASASSIDPAGVPEPNDIEALIPVSIHQLLTALQDNPIYIDGRPAHQVSLVCRVSTVSQSITATEFTLTDSTGSIEARQQHFESDAPTQHTFSGEYAEVFGRPSTCSNGVRNLVLQHAVPLADPNQITTHLLSVIFAHLRCTRGALPAAPETAAAKVARPDSAGTKTSPKKTMEQQAATATPGAAAVAVLRPLPIPGATRPPLNGSRAALSPTHREVLQACRDHRADTGVHISVLITEMSKRLMPVEIRAALEWLSDHGIVFTTVSDDHWQASDS